MKLSALCVQYLFLGRTLIALRESLTLSFVLLLDSVHMVALITMYPNDLLE